MSSQYVYKFSNVKFLIGIGVDMDNIDVAVPMDAIEDIFEDGEVTVTIDREIITKQLDRDNGGLFSVKSGIPAQISVPIMSNSKWIPILDAAIMGEVTMAIIIQDENKYPGAKRYSFPICMGQIPEISFGSEAGATTYVFEAINGTITPTI